MGRIRYALKTNPRTAKAYSTLKKRKDALCRKAVSSGSHLFVDRSQGSDTLCIVLAGYKEQLYPAVFGRIAAVLPPGIDMCVVSSGLHSDALDKLCAQHGWSYLSTRRNNVSLVQNMAIELHPRARLIFKLDEDVFVCNDYFNRMKGAYLHAQHGRYRPGVLAPLINLNGFGSYHLLERLKLLGDFEQRFGRLRCETGRHTPIESKPEVARYLWSEGGIVPTIDELDKLVQDDEQRELACPNVFSIGAILFERTLWEDMGFFPVRFTGSSLGQDEVKLCTFCHMKSRPIMVSMNVVVGHLSFKPQNATMMEYYLQHTQLFLPQGQEGR